MVARHYDELDGYYRELWGEDLHHGLWRRGDEGVPEATESLTSLIAERAHIRAGDRVCDVGCGYGGPARLLAERRGAHVVGVTVSAVQHRVAVARAAGDPQLRFLLADWMDNGLPTGAFDAVIAIESASHMSDKLGFLRECRRVLAPSGRVVAAAWMAGERPRPWEVRHLLRPICTDGRLAGLPTESEYRRWIPAAGLRLVSFEDLSRDVRRTWTVCVRRVCRRLARDADARRYLLDAQRTERRFASAVARIWLAYRTGALRYGLFTARVAQCAAPSRP